MSTKRKLPYREIHIPIPLLKSGVIVMLSEDIPRCVANVRKWYESDFDEWDKSSIHGTTFYKSGYNGVAVWLPKFPETPYEFSTAFHEIFHATIIIMTERMETPLTKETHEIFAHLGEYITHELFDSGPSSQKAKIKKAKEQNESKLDDSVS